MIYDKLIYDIWYIYHIYMISYIIYMIYDIYIMIYHISYIYYDIWYMINFDRVPREVVWWALRQMDVDGWLINAVKSMYKNAKTSVKVNGVEGCEMNYEWHKQVGSKFQGVWSKFQCCSNSPTDEDQGQIPSRSFLSLWNLSVISSCYSDFRYLDWFWSYGTERLNLGILCRNFLFYRGRCFYSPAPTHKNSKCLSSTKSNDHGLGGFLKIWLKSVGQIQRSRNRSK